MAYFREYRNKHGALIRRALILTAKDRALQRQRRDDKLGCPAWRSDFNFQNRRDHWRAKLNLDTEDNLRWWIADLSAHLALYRQRYYANLRVKYGRAPIVFSFESGTIMIWNWALDLSLDQWAIDCEIHQLRHIESIARIRRITL